MAWLFRKLKIYSFSNRGKNSFQICIFEIGQFGKISYKIGQERPDNYNK
jgi:hypothetical protein